MFGCVFGPLHLFGYSSTLLLQFRMCCNVVGCDVAALPLWPVALRQGLDFLWRTTLEAENSFVAEAAVDVIARMHSKLSRTGALDLAAVQRYSSCHMPCVCC